MLNVVLKKLDHFLLSVMLGDCLILGSEEVFEPRNDD